MNEPEPAHPVSNRTACHIGNVERFFVRNTIAAVALLAVWMLLDFVDVMSGQRYQPSENSALVALGLMALTFAVTTWFVLPNVAIGWRTLLTVGAAATYSAVETIIGTLVVIYFHVLIGGYL